MNRNRRTLTQGLGAALLGAGLYAPLQAALAQTWPSQPIRILVGLQAGTGSDLAVRALAERLGAALKQPVTVENLPGASGLLAARRAVTAAPDGYSLVALSGATVTSIPVLMPNAGFDPFRDLVPVGMVATIPSVFFVRPDLPARTLPDFVRMAKDKPGSMTYASGGIGSVQHIGMEAFKSQTGIELVHVPFRGSAQVMVDVAGGRVDGGLQGVSTVLPFLKSDRVRVLASTGDRRTNLLPNVPTVKELGIDFTYEPWTALFAPAGTPREVVAELNAAMRRISADPEFKARFESMGLGTLEDPPEAVTARIRAEYHSNARIIRERNIRVN